jgi:hypothetical protein
LPLSHDDLEYAVSLVHRICWIAGDHDMVGGLRRRFREGGLLQAIRLRDDGAIFAFLMEEISYQGVSDRVASRYIEQHGLVTAHELERGIRRKDLCSKLDSYWRFEGCGYRKAAASCTRMEFYRRCPLPRHDLRNGSLNQAAYSLHFFMRDVAGGDFVGWLDDRLARADDVNLPQRAQLMRDAVVAPLLNIHGVSDKVLNMTLACLLLGGDLRRKRWQMAGAVMIAVDTLVHNWMWRSGVLRRLGALHSYGAACYGHGGCAEIIERLSREIDARDYCKSYPAYFPRFVQHAIWSFCSASKQNRCNGNKIDDSHRCDLSDCPLFSECDRVRLGLN